jgi:hypothetical protein
MSVSTKQAVVKVPLSDLERLIRRVIREELARQQQQSILGDWSHEGLDDTAGDEELLNDALMASQEYRTNKEGWLSWEDFEAEIERAEAAGELPD